MVFFNYNASKIISTFHSFDVNKTADIKYVLLTARFWPSSLHQVQNIRSYPKVWKAKYFF